MGVGSEFDHKYNPEITNAIKHQQEIEVNMMTRGLLSKQWVHTIHPSRNPPPVMVKLQRLIWLELFGPLWKNRNDLLHNTANLYTQKDGSKLAKRITWYCKNRHQLLNNHGTHLADITNLLTLHTMPTDQKREWVRHFEIEKDTYDKERLLVKQKSILEYMTPRPKPTRPTPRKHHTTNLHRTTLRHPKTRITHHQHKQTYKPQKPHKTRTLPAKTKLHQVTLPPQPPKPL
jgi:hypothetical protein